MSITLYILVVATSVQVFYFLFFFARIIFYKQKNSKNTNLPSVSIIVCAHNERKNLEALIPSILRQQYNSFELIIVDDRSEDGSYEYFAELYKNDDRVRIIRVAENNEGKNYKKYALTKAIESSKNEVLLFTDADCVPVSDKWVSQMVESMGEDKEIVLGYSPYAERPGLLNLLIRFETLHTAAQYLSFSLAGLPYMGVGRNLLYKKSVFLLNNGFATHIKKTGGDDDLFIREVATSKNTSICIAGEGQMVSIPKEDYISWFKQKRRHLSVGTMYNWKHKILLGLQMVSLLLFYGSITVFFYQDYKAALLFLMIRGLVFVVIFALIARKLSDTYKYWKWLLMPIEVVYTLSYLVITLSLLINKRIKWS